MSDQNEWRLDQSEGQPVGRSRRSSASPKTRTMADLLFLPETERSLMNWLLRQQQATLSEVAAHLEQPESVAETLLNDLIAQGFIQIKQETCHYQPNLVSRKGRNVPGNIWDALS
ncbi:BlaI/MecI/CopY family transcriptional regulator [Leptolyngbya ohadii]|uniref:BlaI/MecI/CopY family transcriptional regulator n=1 Tax=Leptolyngbya ohadii TaxID=1962290 RepID=UPI000B5A0DD5|nr:BlaI/MecI/CopY family transcriptional regulator [Leptolyngbya ohadii]